ncbi:MAG TPA: FGGY-family carbohydrate kinase, partial [Vicinamibacterales bacterium]|nr:FGGY-family carbohydrate kinase [Vicinamibacterales bacterium]
LRWDLPKLLDGIREGLGRAAAATPPGVALTSVGVDSWGVDYALLDADGEVLEEPVCYRDERTAGVIERAIETVSRAEIFRTTGVQLLPFNTLFQLIAHCEEGLPPRAARLLMIPDLCHHRLCGSISGEITNASTTQLLNVETGRWDEELFSRFKLPLDLMPALSPPRTMVGELDPVLRAELHLPDVRVVQPATHDTASAVAGTPLQANWAYISSGTWSLVGVERAAPLVDDVVLAANFTNERGVDGSIRFLKNVMGLWILESCWREWRSAGLTGTLASLIGRAAALGTTPGVVFPDASRFFNPASMVEELGRALAETGQQASAEPVLLTRVVLDSLALRYASVLSRLEMLTGQPVEGVHVVGGGALNDYLNQATSDAAGRPVLAGPVEATALGNLIVQAMAGGAIDSLASGRRAIAAAFPPKRYEPRPSATWRDAATRYREIEGS